MMNSEYKGRGGLQDQPFGDREAKDGKVFIHWRGKEVMVLAGRQASKFLRQMISQSDEQQQLIMAKVSKNFKRGNE